NNKFADRLESNNEYWLESNNEFSNRLDNTDVFEDWSESDNGFEGMLNSHDDRFENGCENDNGLENNLESDNSSFFLSSTISTSSASSTSIDNE
ncbi:43597_t:CDS:1, partial [Gigaspora margarita]